MNSLDPNGTFDNRIGVWALTNREAVSSGGIPALSSVVITSEPYGVPPGAVQKGAGSFLDSGDDRMQQVQYMKGYLWGELTTSVTIPNDTMPRAGAAWFKVRPQLDSSGNLIHSAKIVNQGYVASLGNYLIYPGRSRWHCCHGHDAYWRKLLPQCCLHNDGQEKYCIWSCSCCS